MKMREINTSSDISRIYHYFNFCPHQNDVKLDITRFTVTTVQVLHNDPVTYSVKNQFMVQVCHRTELISSNQRWNGTLKYRLEELQIP